MKQRTSHRANGKSDKQSPITARQKLGNFCYSYSPEENDEMLGQLFSIIKQEDQAHPDLSSQERLLNYIESLEEVLPALYAIRAELDTDVELRNNSNYIP